MKGCPFCNSAEVRIRPVEDSWTGTKNYRGICETCDAMGPAADSEELARKFWDRLLLNDDAFNKFIGEGYEGTDLWDEVALDEFGMDYEQLGPNEKEWVRDEIENIRDDRSKWYKGQMDEEAMGGVSAPAATLNNTPGVGNATPAAAADGNAIGSGDKWGDGPMYDQNGKVKKKKSKIGTKKAEKTKKSKNPFGDPVKESNLSPYDKIGQMIAKEMGVKQTFKPKGDPANNEVEQEHWKEQEPPNLKAPDQKTQQLSTGKIHEIGIQENGKFTLQTLDNYFKASKHVPDHPLTSKKKGMELNEEDLRDTIALKDIKGKETMEDLGIAYEFKPGPSGKERCYIKEPMKDVLSKLEQAGWEKKGKNPENTVWLFRKDSQDMKIWADGKALPRVTVEPTPEEPTTESVKPVIKKLVSSSFDPYIKNS